MIKLSHFTDVRLKSDNDQITDCAVQSIVSFREPDINTITGIDPLIKQTACGKNVWVLYATCNENRSPIRVIIENGVRKMHLFDFITTLTGCAIKNMDNEWTRIEKSLEKAILTKIRIAQTYKFPRLDRSQLARSDSMVVDIYQAAKVALAIGQKANWFTEILVSLSKRFMSGDLSLADGVEYMHIAQRLIAEYEPDNFLRLWAEEFLANTPGAEEQQAISNSENIVDSMAPTVSDVIEESGIIHETTTATARAKARTRGRRSQSARPYRSYSRARERNAKPNTIGCLYMYELIPVYKTREEAYKYLKLLGVNIDEFDYWVIICKNDLDGGKLVKIGKTELSSMERQVNYVNGLSQLYDVNLTTRVQYDINFVAKLGDIEDEVKAKFFTPDRVGLVKSDGRILYPSEVFKVDCLDKTNSEIENVIGEFQVGTPFNPSLTESKNVEIKLREMEETTKQMEETTKQMELRIKLRAIEILNKRGVSDEKVLMSL